LLFLGEFFLFAVTDCLLNLAGIARLKKLRRFCHVRQKKKGGVKTWQQPVLQERKRGFLLYGNIAGGINFLFANVISIIDKKVFVCLWKNTGGGQNVL
jgi:hypothetical protein